LDSPDLQNPPPEIDPATTPAHRSGRFLVLDSVELHKSSSRVTCIVKLRRRDLCLRGEGSELDTPPGRARAAARATLGAAAQTIENVSFGLEGAAFIDLFGRRYVIVSVEAAHRRRFIILSGIVALDAARSLEEAAALATLRAVDRWIGG
jgi:hypothetical protein